MMPDALTKLAVFFTWDVSLNLWREKGLYEREIKLYQQLAQNGIDVTFLTWGGAEEKALAPEGIRVIPIYEHLPVRPDNKVLRALVSLSLPWYLREQLKTFDLYKSNQMWGAWCPALSKLFFRKPFIMRCGFELYDFTRRQGHNILRQMFVWLISWLTYLSATHICVATTEDKNVVEKTFGIDSGKISIHPNWIDTDTFRPIEMEEKPHSILFVGRLSEQKNIRALIEAVKDTGWTLDFIGDGELRRDIKVKGADVNFLGPMPNDQLPALYNAYTVYVLPSHYEGNPKTLLEAMSCGRPVLGTNVPGIRNVIEHEKSGLLCAPNPKGIQDGLARLLEDEALRAFLGAAAREQIIATQTLPMLVKKELALYKILS